VHHDSNIRACLALAIAVLSAAVLLPSQLVLAQSSPPPDSAFTYNETRPVLAYYYAWWEPEKIMGARYTPAQHFPSGIRQLVDSPALLHEHMLEAMDAGIDGFIVNRPSDMAVLLQVARGTDFRVTLQVDAASGAESQLRQFYQYVDHPNMVRYQGRPVVFFWQAPSVNNERWSSVRGQLDPDHTALWIADGDRFGILAGDAWDGISPYAIAWSANPRGQLPAWAAKARAAAADKLFIPPVSPGCDDRSVREATCIQERADGAYYESTWEGALAARPAWAVVVSTFNEWMEASQIEPSVQYGDLYLQITRDFADRFRSPVARSS
jgi:hypothetical protein